MEHALSPAEFARATRLSMQHVYSLLAAGRLDAQKVDGRWQIATSELEKRQQRNLSADELDQHWPRFREIERMQQQLGVRDPEFDELAERVDGLIRAKYPQLCALLAMGSVRS